MPRRNLFRLAGRHVLRANPGTLRWSFAGGAISASPALGPDGAIYLGSYDRKLYALNHDGSKRWEFVTGDLVISSAVIAGDGTIYFGSYDHKLYARDRDGHKRWEFLAGKAFIGTPALADDGTIYLGAEDGKLYALGPDGSAVDLYDQVASSLFAGSRHKRKHLFRGGRR